MLVKPKCVWESVVILKNCKQTAKNVNKFLKKTTTQVENPVHLFKIGKSLILVRIQIWVMKNTV